MAPKLRGELGHGGSVEVNLAATRSWFETLCARISGKISAYNPKTLKDEIHRLEEARDTYKRAFETTSTDRDRITAERDTYKHAFETTVADRDRITAQRDLVTTRFKEAVDPLDAGSFRLNLRKFRMPENVALADRLGEEWESKFDDGAMKEVVDSVLENTSVGLAFPLINEDLRPVAAYMLASFHAERGQFEKAVRYAKHFHYAASIDGANLLPYDIKQGSRLAHYRQQGCVALNAPGAVLVSMLRSASAFLSNAVSQIFEVPVMRISIGQGTWSAVITRWADQVAAGGAITHEHFRAVPVNLQALSDSRVSKVWIQIRDPRDTAYSLSKMTPAPFVEHPFYAADDVDDGIETVHWEFIEYAAFSSNWIQQWLDASAGGKYDLDIQFLKYQDITGDLTANLRRMFPDHFDPARERKAIEFLSQWESGKVDRRNFRKGVGQEWRTLYPDSVRMGAWKRIADNVKEFLQLDS